MRFYRTNDNQSNSAQADYVVNVFNIGGITSVGLYQAPIGSHGELKKNGTLRADTITRDKLKGPDHGANVSDIEARINDGDLYCLLTTLDNPKGELRGQVVHPDGFSFSQLPILGPPVAPVPVPVPVVIPTIVAVPSPVPIPAPAPSPSPPPPATTVVPVLVPVNVSSPSPSPSPPPSPSPSPPPSPVAVVTVPVPVPVPAPSSPSPSPAVAVVPVPVPVPTPSSPSPSPSPTPVLQLTLQFTCNGCVFVGALSPLPGTRH
ncbi:g11027 [Coccomyxa viridis]|uniref:G11027 protein n=1 Tax=Coccomyxa viridis TaxID=1274662 RepID=A0ABP1GCS8_9CHLO